MQRRCKAPRQKLPSCSIPAFLKNPFPRIRLAACSASGISPSRRQEYSIINLPRGGQWETGKHEPDPLGTRSSPSSQAQPSPSQALSRPVRYVIDTGLSVCLRRKITDEGLAIGIGSGAQARWSTLNDRLGPKRGKQPTPSARADCDQPTSPE